MKAEDLRLEDIDKEIRLLDCPKEHLGKRFQLILVFDNHCELLWINSDMPYEARRFKTHLSNIEIVENP
jgi:hypothetical protein